jgi:hypothetical protein
VIKFKISENQREIVKSAEISGRIKKKLPTDNRRKVPQINGDKI